MHFDTTWYLAAYPDVKSVYESGGIPDVREHYLIHGWREGRLPRADYVQPWPIDLSRPTPLPDILIANHQLVRFATTQAVAETLHDLHLFRRYDEKLTENLHDQFTVPRDAVFEEYCSFNGNLENIGAFSYSENDFLQMQMGRFCSIGRDLEILGERHPMEWVTTSPITYCFTPEFNKPQFLVAHRDQFGGKYRPMELPPPRSLPVIEHDVWIGAHVQLARGIRIGTGSVIAAGSVVTKNVAPYTVVGGNPARVIRRRFDPALCDRLLASQWWTYHPEILWQFGFSDPERFLEQFEAAKADNAIAPASYRTYSWLDLADALLAWHTKTALGRPTQ